MLQISDASSPLHTLERIRQHPTARARLVAAIHVLRIRRRGGHTAAPERPRRRRRAPIRGSPTAVRAWSGSRSRRTRCQIVACSSACESLPLRLVDTIHGQTPNRWTCPLVAHPGPRRLDRSRFRRHVLLRGPFRQRLEPVLRIDPHFVRGPWFWRLQLATRWLAVAGKLAADPSTAPHHGPCRRSGPERKLPYWSTAQGSHHHNRECTSRCRRGPSAALPAARDGAPRIGEAHRSGHSRRVGAGDGAAHRAGRRGSPLRRRGVRRHPAPAGG